MRCSSRRAIVFLGISATVMAAAAACGSPQSATSVTGTPPSVSATPSGLDATATAFFDIVNRKLAAGGEPTFAPGTDPLNPFADVTYPPEPTNTPGPSPTPLAPACGATIAGWDEILAQYGGFYMGNGCSVYDGQLVIGTAGINGGPGAIATYRCQASDASCLQGNAPDASGAAWSVYPTPYGGVVSIRGFVPPDLLLIEPGDYCFNLTTYTYYRSKDCLLP